MSKTIKIDKNPYDDVNLFKTNTLTFEPGLTVLVGANGTGKSTVLQYIKDQCRMEDTPCIIMDNLHEGGQNIASNALFFNDIGLAASAMIASEGERINLAIGQHARKLGHFVMKEHKDAKEICILFDAIDSGLSIDNIVSFKDDLIKTILELKPDHQDIYVIAAANAYELARGEDCLDVHTGKHRVFKTYDAYRNFVLRSRKRRDNLGK